MPSAKLSEHFTLAEFVASQTAARYGIPNDPPANILSNLKTTAALMEEVRALLGDNPIYISSGYRSPDLNAAIGGATNSAHVFGQAADFTCPAAGNVREICLAIEASNIQYDQLIREFDTNGTGWVHIAWRDVPRRQALTIDGAGTRVGIV